MNMVSGIRLWRSTRVYGGLGFLEAIDRIPRQHVGWCSITYKGERYQLGGGIRTEYFINLDNPIVRKTC